MFQNGCFHWQLSARLYTWFLHTAERLRQPTLYGVYRCVPRILRMPPHSLATPIRCYTDSAPVPHSSTDGVFGDRYVITLRRGRERQQRIYRMNIKSYLLMIQSFVYLKRNKLGNMHRELSLCVPRYIYIRFWGALRAHQAVKSGPHYSVPADWAAPERLAACGNPVCRADPLSIPAGRDKAPTLLYSRYYRQGELIQLKSKAGGFVGVAHRCLCLNREFLTLEFDKATWSFLKIAMLYRT